MDEFTEKEETKKKKGGERAKETTQKPATETEWKGKKGIKNELRKARKSE